VDPSAQMPSSVEGSSLEEAGKKRRGALLLLGEEEATSAADRKRRRVSLDSVASKHTYD